MFEASALKKKNEALSARVRELEEALRRLLRHEPWPGSDRSEEDYRHGAELLERRDAED